MWRIKVVSTPVITVTSSTQSYLSAQNPSPRTTSDTPQMSVLFKESNNTKVGYFGKLEFLDNQAALDEVFGDKRTIIAPNIITSQDTTSAARILYSFGKKCKVHVFLHIFRKYYVRHDSLDNSLSVQDLCRQISEIKQEQKYKNGKLMQGSPDEMFDKFLQLSRSLPESARAWPIQLC